MCTFVHDICHDYFVPSNLQGVAQEGHVSQLGGRPANGLLHGQQRSKLRNLLVLVNAVQVDHGAPAWVLGAGQFVGAADKDTRHRRGDSVPHQS